MKNKQRVTRIDITSRFIKKEVLFVTNKPSKNEIKKINCYFCIIMKLISFIEKAPIQNCSTRMLSLTSSFQLITKTLHIENKLSLFRRNHCEEIKVLPLISKSIKNIYFYFRSVTVYYNCIMLRCISHLH